MSAAMARRSGSYSFASQPRAVAANRYRDPFAPADPSQQTTNLMYDRRVIRGNTYAANTLQPTSQEAEQLRKAATRATKTKQQDGQARTMPAMSGPRAASPEAVMGRRHMDIQTEEYLEEITDRVPETEIACQTDEFEDRPATPPFVPQKRGVDAGTQVEEGELFDFDVEVEPLLEVLVGKTLEQSMLEVMEEEELASMRRHQREFEQKRNAELAEVQRMEAAERRRFEEKERRKQQERERVEREKETLEKLAARKQAKEVLSDLEKSVFQDLTNTGFFYDRVEREVESSFMDTLTSNVQAKLEKRRVASGVVDQLLRSAIRKHMRQSEDAREKRRQAEAELARLAAEKEAEERAALEAAEAEKRAQEAAAAAAAAEAAAAEAAEADGEEDEENDEEGESDEN